jgi:hypothetical protein
MNIDVVISIISLFLMRRIIGNGINRTISISKTIKITAKRKNRVENGIRAEFNGSNPHSKGEVFSRSLVDRLKIMLEIIKSVSGIMILIVDEINMSFIKLEI